MLSVLLKIHVLHSYVPYILTIRHLIIRHPLIKMRAKPQKFGKKLTVFV